MNGSCAKFIVCGEYAALNGSSCVAYPLTKLRMEIGSPKGNILPNDEQKSKFLELSNLMGLGFTIDTLPKINSNIPLGAGLGSSAALCVELAKLKTKSVDPSKIFELARKGENLFHGKSSGVDPACISFEKAIVFQNSPHSVRMLRVHENFHSSYWILRKTDATHSTKDGIAECLSHPDWPSIEADIRVASKDIVKCLEQGLNESLVESLNKNSQSLQKLSCHTTRIEEACKELRSLGCLATKLTGSGFGGYVLGLIQKDKLRTAELKKNDLIISLAGVDETEEWT